MKYLLILLLFLCQICFSQDIKYARKVVDTLASHHMKGRGYVENGERKAADYIATEFESIGLKSFAKNYRQKFITPVNTFPASMSLEVNGKALVPGKDFLIEPGSPSVEGSFEAVSISAEDFLDEGQLIFKMKDSFGKFIVIEPFAKGDFSEEEIKRINDIVNFLKYHEDNPGVGTIVMSFDKLTWSGSTSQTANPAFTIKVDSLFDSISKINVKVEAKFHKKYEMQNLVGYLEGVKSDSIIAFVAHYDHLGMMGKETVFPGANDNASGVAMLLNLAKYYQENKPEYTMVFIAFGAEELGLLGAKHFTENPYFSLDKIKFLLNFDISGTGEEGIQVVNGSVYNEEFEKLKRINESENLLHQVKVRGEACNSDHCMFHIKGVPSFFIYTLGGVQAYHDIYDRAETLPLTEFEDYFKLITKFVDAL